MQVTRVLTAVSLVAAFSMPAVALAQSTPYSQVVITTQLGAGVAVPAVAPVVNIVATAPVMYGVSSLTSTGLSYSSNFSNDVRTVNFVPGSYSVTASGSPYYFIYSSDCSGFTPLNGAVKSCTITLSTTPPVSSYPCGAGYYGINGCAAPVVPYAGPYGSSQLACTPAYQTVSAGQSAAFTATGGTPGGFNWSTADRTFLNIGPTLSSVFQSTGTQTVIVSNGVQNATCTVNVVAGTGAISYAGAPSILTNYIPAYLPNTGFGPQDGSVLAFAFVLLIAAGIVFSPYVRKTLAIIIG